LVRYETGITVVEAGRFGNSGFAVRGVDENRVAVQIDGLHQAETISSQGFKELFEGYGNFNNTRNSAEIETLKQVTIRKGADSLKSGSGALGGSVSFETKDARDYLTDKNYYASYKRGYNTADNQNLNTLTLAGRYKYFDAIAVITSRKGHELE
ncbi:TonB-dependent receptor plug domain-containing protein, partial [Haemophilus influenzae]